MADKLIITREQILKLNPCDNRIVDALFEESPFKVDDNTLEYPEGWTTEDSARVVKKNPMALIWLCQVKVIPLTKLELIQAFRDAGAKFPTARMKTPDTEPPPPPQG